MRYVINIKFIFILAIVKLFVAASYDHVFAQNTTPTFDKNVMKNLIINSVKQKLKMNGNEGNMGSNYGNNIRNNNLIMNADNGNYNSGNRNYYDSNNGFDNYNSNSSDNRNRNYGNDFNGQYDNININDRYITGNRNENYPNDGNSRDNYNGNNNYGRNSDWNNRNTFTSRSDFQSNDLSTNNNITNNWNNNQGKNSNGNNDFNNTHDHSGNETGRRLGKKKQINNRVSNNLGKSSNSNRKHKKNSRNVKNIRRDDNNENGILTVKNIRRSFLRDSYRSRGSRWYPRKNYGLLSGIKNGSRVRFKYKIKYYNRAGSNVMEDQGSDTKVRPRLFTTKSYKIVQMGRGLNGNREDNRRLIKAKKDQNNKYFFRSINHKRRKCC